MTDNLKENTSGQSESREIKYRAWDLQLHIMGEVVELGMRDGSMLSMLYEGGQTYGNIKYYRIMQYTGLKDKNGVDIYDGDVITMGGTIKYVIERKTPSFLGRDIGTKGSYIGTGYGDWSRDVEVIGNIYENPELLSEK